MQPERIQKFLASQGIASRRKIDSWLQTGRISVDGTIAQPGDKVTDKQVIRIDGRIVRFASQRSRSKHRIIMYHKPVGEICDNVGHTQNVFSKLPQLVGRRWISIGRLDVNTSGLLLLTTNGKLAANLMHPRFAIDREYSVRVFGNVQDKHIQQLLKGVKLNDGYSAFTDIVANQKVNTVEQKSDSINQWFTVCLQSGRNREVRRMWEALGFAVNRLKRVRYGPIFLPSTLKQGQWRDLNAKEADSLRLVE